jgi:hypothetical protein
MFDRLDLEEHTGNFGKSPSASSASSTTQRPRQKKSDYTFESDDEQQYFVIFCLFEDLERLGEQVASLWRRYASRRIDLVDVVLATNTATEVARLLEREVMNKYPDLSNYRNVMESLTGILAENTYNSNGSRFRGYRAPQRTTTSIEFS